MAERNFALRPPIQSTAAQVELAANVVFSGHPIYANERHAHNVTPDLPMPCQLMIFAIPRRLHAESPSSTCFTGPNGVRVVQLAYHPPPATVLGRT